jgi:ATP-dependent Clp protease ATP-binding subunit ClpA
VECSSSSLVLPTLPTLSNALVAALKRAQASQRRRCVDLRSQTPSPPSATHQQTVLTIKVELDQLIVSILDEPSVSSVMREASFSSAAVKACLEEETSLGHHGSASSALQFLTSQPDAAAEPEPESPRCICTKDKEADVRTILEVMSPRKKQGTRRINPVVVGDSASAAEASVAELMRRIETGGGDVPDDLRGARVLRLHLSHARVRLMARADVDAWAADLRRTVANAKANVIYVGDMRWAVDDDQAITWPPRWRSCSASSVPRDRGARGSWRPRATRPTCGASVDR